MTQNSEGSLKRNLKFCPISLIPEFERTRTIYKDVIRSGIVNEDSIKELISIHQNFIQLDHKPGIIYCIKAMGIIKHTLGNNEKDPSIKLQLYRLAHELFCKALLLANEWGLNQLSHYKHLAKSKMSLGDILHHQGDHSQANTFELEAFKIYREMLHIDPDYTEGRLDSILASYNKIKWFLYKIQFDLDKSERILNNPKIKRHQLDAEEVIACQKRISQLKTMTNTILNITSHETLH